MTNTFQFVVSLINLVLLYFVVKAIVIDPLKKVAAEREASARKRIDDADSVLAEARTHNERYQGLLAGVDAEKRQIEETARVEAEKVRARVAETAESEARHMVARAQQEAQMQRDAARAELRAGVAEAAVSRARGLLEKSLDATARRDILENFLMKVGGGDA